MALMRLWPKQALDAVADVQQATASASATVYPFPSASWGSPTDQAWSWTAPVSRADAVSVPACSRALDLVASTIAGLPIQRFTAAGAPAPLGWLEQPEPDRPRYATINDLVRDLILDGVGWLVPGGLRQCCYVPVDHVQVEHLQDRNAPWRFADKITIDGIEPPGILRFWGWHDGIRHHGARTLRTALALQGAAKTRADSPLPQTTLRNTSNYELTDEEITALLAAYRQARASSSTAYLNSGVEETHNGWTSVELQLVEAQSWYAAAVCNLVGVPSSFVAGAAVANTTLTYSNVTMEMQSLLATGAVRSAISSLEATLTAADPGHYVRVNIGALLRGNPKEVADIIAVLQPLGLVTDLEARQWLDMATTGGLA